MKVICKKLLSKRIDCIAAIGVFDGIHLGHRFVLEHLKKLSQKTNLPSLLITFDTPPQVVLNRSMHAGKKFPGLLTDTEDKKKIFSAMGIDYLWLIKNSRSFLKLSGNEFINYLFRHFHVKHIIVGKDFHFGHKRSSNIRFLEKISKKYGFGVTVLNKTRKYNRVISSSLLRSLIRIAEFGKVKSFLGRNYYIKGKVVTGSGYGESLGFPTANVNYNSYVIPNSGVYSAIIEVDRQKHLCAVNIGFRPTMNKSASTVIEVHIIGFRRNITGKKIKLLFIKKIRNEKKFSSKKILIKAIRNDICFIKKQYSKEKERLNNF